MKSSQEIHSNKIVLESLSMDLLRVAIGLHRGSKNMAKKFEEEALARSNELDKRSLKPYLQTILLKLQTNFKSNSDHEKAEEALMYSTLIRNYCTKYLS